MATRIVRIPREDDGSFVLIHVTPATSGSSRPPDVDLTLIGTEGAAPYVRELKHSEVLSHKAKRSPCSEDEWQTILESVLLGRHPDEARELLRDVEAVAVVDDEKSITIKVQRRVERITQPLGSFKLPYNGSQEIELFEWCGVATGSVQTLTDELSTLQSKFQKQQDTISKLNAQLEELIQAKIDHETELIEKFRLLLNEKKSKIRDQSRILAFSKVDPKKMAEVEASRKGRSAGASRSGKRKEQSTDDSEDGAFEKMDADGDKASNHDSDARDVVTPEPSDDETADEEEEPVAPAPAKNTRSSKATASKSSKASSNLMESLDKSQSTPPRRELPFGKKAAPPKEASLSAKPVVDEGDDTESDDEL